jgi:hypothetical protein
LVGGKLGSSGEKIDINDTVEVYMASVHCFDVIVSIVGLSMDQRIVDTTVVDQQSQGRKGRQRTLQVCCRSIALGSVSFG